MIEINIARDFTKLPGPRYRDQGPGSGQQFLEKYLRPAFLKAREANEQVTIQLDGVQYGYPHRFSKKRLGDSPEKFGIEEVQNLLRFESVAEPMLDFEIRHYIKHANDTPGTSPR